MTAELAEKVTGVKVITTSKVGAISSSNRPNQYIVSSKCTEQNFSCSHYFLLSVNIITFWR